MNDSKLQNAWTKLPWGIFLFLLVVFVFATPYDFSFRFTEALSIDEYSSAERLRGSNIGRQAALFSLGTFALISFLRKKRNRFQINGLLGWLILFYLVWAALSIIWSIDMRFTVKRVGIFVLLFLGALAVAERLSLRDTVVLTFFITGITLLAAIAVELAAGTFQPFNGSWRFAGFMHPIMQGWNCGLLAFSAFALSRSVTRHRTIFWGISFIALLLLVLTKGRMAFAAFIVGTVVYWSLVSSRPQKVALVLGIAFIGCLMYFSLGDVIITHHEQVMRFGREQQSMESIGTLTGRIPLWKESLRHVNQRPLLGYGYNSFLSPDNLIRIAHKVGWAAVAPHSGYIEALLGLGLIGAGTLVTILFLSVKTSISLSKRNPEYAFMATFLVWLCCNLVLESSIITRPFFTNFLFMALIAKLGFLQKEREGGK